MPVSGVHTVIYLSYVNIPAMVLAMKYPAARIVCGTKKNVFRQTGDHKRLGKALQQTNINTLICNTLKNNQTKQRYSFGFLSACWHSWSNHNLRAHVGSQFLLTVPVHTMKAYKGTGGTVALIPLTQN